MVHSQAEKLKTLSIGELERSSGLGRATIRFYERKALIKSQPRQGYFKRYAPVVAEDLKLIRTGKSLGFTLREVRELLSLSRQEDCRPFLPALRKKLVLVEEKLRELNQLRDRLGAILKKCEPGCRFTSVPVETCLATTRC